MSSTAVPMPYSSPHPQPSIYETTAVVGKDSEGNESIIGHEEVEHIMSAPEWTPPEYDLNEAWSRVRNQPLAINPKIEIPEGDDVSSKNP